MITVLEIVLSTAACLFLTAWILSAVGLALGMRRAAKRSGFPVSTSYYLTELPRDAFLNAINVVWFLGALLWHRLLRKPLPPARRPGQRR